MFIPIKTTEERYFKTVFKALNFVLKLSRTELDVLASIALVLYKNRGVDGKKLEEAILSYNTRVALRTSLGMSEASLNNNISSLKKKALIVKTNSGFVLSDPIRNLFPGEDKSFSIELKISIDE